jgi:hypothetical protein
MSRHTLSLSADSKGWAVVGYDRPVGAFFCQVWESENADHPVFDDACFDIDQLPALGVVVPEGLREILVKEACGQIDPNYCKDWRPPCPTQLT